MLGARPGGVPHGDIAVDSSGLVQAATGGMSVFDDPQQLPKHRKPAWLAGGEGRDPLFHIRLTSLTNHVDRLPVALAVRYDGLRGHAVVEPATTCPFVAYMAALCLTRASWLEVQCHPN